MPNFEQASINSPKSGWSEKYTLPDGTRISTEAEKRIDSRKFPKQDNQNEKIDFEDKKAKIEFFRGEAERTIDALIKSNPVNLEKNIVYAEIDFLESVRSVISDFERSVETDFSAYLKKQIEISVKNLDNIKKKSPRQDILVKQLNSLRNAEEFIQYYQGQEWLDESREFSHDKLISFFDQLREKGGEQAVRKRFLEFFGPLMKANTGQTITAEEMYSLQVETLTMRSASEIAGRKIKRSVINFYDRGQYNKFIKAIFGESFTPPGGFYLPPGDLDGTIFEKTGMIFAVQGRAVIESKVGHEIRHSIDPYMGDRQNYDRIIDEVFAYYFNIFKENKNPSAVNAWGEYLDSIDQPEYYERYSIDANNVISREQYSDLCKRAIDSIKKFRGSHNDVETQRMIAQCKTLNDLFEINKKPGH